MMNFVIIFMVLTVIADVSTLISSNHVTLYSFIQTCFDHFDPSFSSRSPQLR